MDAVFVAIAVTGLVLLGFRPLELLDVAGFREERDPWIKLVFVFVALINFALAAIVILKGRSGRGSSVCSFSRCW